MFASFSEFKFYQSFRIPVEEADDLRFLVEKDDEMGKPVYISDAKLVDISVTGLGFITHERISVGMPLTISLQFKKHHLDLVGTVVRAFTNRLEDDSIIYGVELDAEKGIHKFLETYIQSFSTDRLKDCLIDSALKERYANATEGFEMFSLLLTLFKDITNFGDKEGFVDSMLEEVVRIMNAQRASIFLIRPDTNELEAVAALGVEKDKMRFDYRMGVAGSVFTTGVALNIDTAQDKCRWNEEFDKLFQFETKSIVCHPIHNREDKIVGVIEVINKRNEDRFTVEDEKTMKVLALVFSSVFHSYNPISETGQIRRFSTPFDREHVLIGKTPHVASLRGTIMKIKDIDSPILISGEKGVGKKLYSRIIHHEGKRGLRPYEIIHCEQKDLAQLERDLWGEDHEGKLVKCQGGTVVLHEVGQLNAEFQRKLYEVIKGHGVPGSRISVDARIIATTSEDIGQMVDDGEFLPELYEYLNRAYVYMEPLRRRMDDVDLLVDYFLKLECKKQGLLLKEFSPKALVKLKEYDWPTNIKELRTCVERAVLYNPKSHIITEVGLTDNASPLVDVAAKQRLFGDLPHVSDHKISLKDRLAIVEREMIMAEIKRCNGNKSKAAKEMGISREALRKKLIMSEEVLVVLDDDTQTAVKKAA